MTTIEQLPGFRRRIRITAGAGWVRGEVEDDFHCMQVTLRHAQGVVTAMEPVMERAPWTTCPGAVAQLSATFAGIELDRFALRGAKSENCTHLHDLALLAVAHAGDIEPIVYDILVSDPVDGWRDIELRRNGVPLLGWIERNGVITEPAELSGRRLDQLRPWIESLDPARQEAARLLRWGAILGHGRTIPMERQSDARRMPPNCYTFQPQRVAAATRCGAIRDFSRGPAKPLDRAPYTGGHDRAIPYLIT
ncbi:MAG: DUF2889 domain-containing protein [Nevskia sp.]|nr:DUF2889 domain-containing protein [Nevskia sp.]